jgi:hypothetical protein
MWISGISFLYFVVVDDDRTRLGRKIYCGRFTFCVGRFNGTQGKNLGRLTCILNV